MYQLRLGQAARQQIVQNGPPSGFGLTTHVLDSEHYLLTVAADTEPDQQRDSVTFDRANLYHVPSKSSNMS